MLFIPESQRTERREILRATLDNEISHAEAAQRLLRIDPQYGPAFLFLGTERAKAGDLAEAESLMWKALDLLSSSFHASLPEDLEDQN